ncbi:MAG TPA: DNA recombination protein RmuC, partial [Terriglobales bacterium]|nr:DNA recombination protein RmuC [Terriglobales bacterium]
MGQVVLVALFTAGVVIGVVLGLRAAKSGNRLEQELRKQIEAGKAELAEAREETGGLREARAAAEARVVEAEKNLADQRSLLGEARGELEKTFRALASEALQQNNSGFLTLAEQKFRALQQAASTDLESKKGAIEQLLQPLSQTLEQYQSESRELQERRAKDISAVGEQLRSLAETQNLLRHETAKLVTALRSPEVRGNWGEIALRRIAELAGMTRHCDFAEQVSITTEDGRLRPDVVVHLPSGREVVIDSKVPLAAYLDAISAPDEDARDAALDRHVSQVHQHIKSLSQNQYWEQFPRAPEFVVMFIRNDSFLA